MTVAPGAREILAIRRAFGKIGRMSRPFLTVLLLVLAAPPAASADWARVSAIFQDRCIACHVGEYAPLGLSLESHAGVMAGSENGPVLAPQAPETSRLYQRITGAAEPRMPLDGPPFLDEAQIGIIRAWIANGAPGPAPESNESTPADTPPPPPDPRADGAVTFGEVERIFLQRCVLCHSDNSKYDNPPEGLRLTSRDDVLAGGERVVVIPGNPHASELIRRVEGLASPRMPFDGPPWLSDEDVALLRDWIAGGAMDDAMRPAATPVGARVRLRGILTAPDAIDGARFTITSGTRIDDRPAIGRPAEMRGRVAADGTIVATRLRGR